MFIRLFVINLYHVYRRKDACSVTWSSSSQWVHCDTEISFHCETL